MMRSRSVCHFFTFFILTLLCGKLLASDFPDKTPVSDAQNSRRIITTPLRHQALDKVAQFLSENRPSDKKQTGKYLSDNSQEFNFTNILFAQGWHNNPTDKVLNFGFTQDVYWIRLPLKFSGSGEQALQLVIPYPLLENVDLMAVTPNGETLFRSDLKKQRQFNRTEDFQSLIFPLPPNLSGDVDIYLRVQSTTSMQIPLEIWSAEYTQSRHSQGMLLWGIYFGVISALILYNGFLFFSVRDITYCYYALYLVASMGVMLCLSGLGNSYFWTLESSFSRHALTFFTGTMSLMLLAFARSFLNWNGFPPSLNRILAVGVAVCLGLIIFAWFNPVLGAHLAAWSGSITITLALGVGFYALKRGLVIARYFFLAFLMFAAGASTYLLNVFGVLPVSPLTTHSIQLGSALEAVLLSLALAHRIKEDRVAAINALQQQHQTEQQLKQMELEALDSAMHDPMTHMPNDSLLLTRLQDWQRTHQGNGHFGLVLLQIPQVREVASSLGRETADPFFCSLVQSLNKMLEGSGETLCIEEKIQAHVVVIEFGLLAFLCQNAENTEVVKGFIERVQSHYEGTFDVGNISINIDMFFGIAHYPSHGDRAEVLLQHANAALEDAHRNGHRVSVYHSGIDAYGQRRLILMAALSRAIKQAELEIYVQPQLDCRQRALAGAELLLRWNSNRLGSVPTQEFIEIAENAGMMKHLTRFVISRGLLFMKQLHQRGIRITVSINLSIQNLVETDFVQYIIDSSRALGVDLGYLVLEVTETSASDNIDEVIDNLNRLAQAGCSIALDDFGTGYSSLAYLSRLPIHELKIDRSFVSRMTQSDSHLRIVENTVTLARALKIETVAEGIEDEAMLNTVSMLGCNRVQGYLLGKPMPTNQFYDWAIRSQLA